MPLVTTTEMFKKAYAGGYAVGAFNVNNMEIIQGITEAAGELKAPVILQVSKGARAYANHIYLVKLVQAAVELNPEIPIALHLDHGDSFELCKSCIDGGFTSVMIDASSKPYEENIALTRQVVEYAHDHGVVVEAELGTLAGVEDEVSVDADKAMYTHPEEVEDFATRTGCDSLAIAIGTSHGAYKFKPGTKPQLRFDVLEECSKRLPRSFFMDLPPCRRNSFRLSTSTAATCPVLSVSRKNSFARRPVVLSVRSTSILTSASQ